MKLFDYQAPAVEWLFKSRRGLVQAPAGSGKTIIAAAALDSVLCRRPGPARIGWLANTREQVEQAAKAIAQFPLVQAQDVKIACAQAGTDWSDRDVLVVDECHHAATALGWQTQIETCAGARWGFTATPPEGAALAALLEMFNGRMFTVDRESASVNLAAARVVMETATDDPADLRARIDSQISANLGWRRKWFEGGLIPRMEASLRQSIGNPALIEKLAQAEQRLWGQVAWQAIIELGIFQNAARNARVVALVQKHCTDAVLVLVNKVEHANQLVLRLPGSVAMHSKMGDTKRRLAIEQFLACEVPCLIATSLADEGLDLPLANVLVLASGGRSKGRTEQRSGRVLRAYEGKTEGIIYDFEDDFHPLAAKQSRSRVEIYRSLGYKIQLA